jgi:hypothetical protein
LRLFFLKHFSLGITAITGIGALLPTLILARFWWALEELKNLPGISCQMMGDAKNELQESVQNIRAGKVPKLGFFSAGKSLWSIGTLFSEVRDLLGSYQCPILLVRTFHADCGRIGAVDRVYVVSGQYNSRVFCLMARRPLHSIIARWGRQDAAWPNLKLNPANQKIYLLPST